MKLVKVALFMSIASTFLGCAMAQAPVNGLFYSDVKSAGLATEAYGGSARGEACATSILGVYASGDASIDTAKKAGGILQVVTIDHTASSILGFYAKYCTIVYGKSGAGSAPKPPAGSGGAANGGKG